MEIDGDATHNPEAIMQIVDLMDKYDIGYGSVNHNRNRCLDCGYENAEKDLHECPHCHGHHIDTCSASPATWWAPPTAGTPASSPNSRTA